MERPGEKLNLRAELDKLEGLIADLKVQYEQYFVGVIPLSPDKLHADVKRFLRYLTNAPFKNSAMNFRLRGLRTRYNTLDTYWQRVLKQREEGTYSKDVFKAGIRERFAQEDERAQTKQGEADKNMSSLFRAYKIALEKESGTRQDLDFKAFRKAIVQRAKALKAEHGGGKISFKVVVNSGQVKVQANIKK